MKFLDRVAELERLAKVPQRGGLAVLYGRRRVGKTRLLLEWVDRADGLYTVADQSAADLQRAHFAHAIAQRLPGFAAVTYPDWRTLLSRLASDARSAGWRGPIVFDELPYLVSSAPELPSVLQQWIDHQAQDAGLTVALAGSSQRMMQGIVLAADAPLYGRARVLMKLPPLPLGVLPSALPVADAVEAVEAYSAWGGIPRYWELAAEEAGTTTEIIDRLVLDALGPLHQEPHRLLLEESPPATGLRPLLDAIGLGAHRTSEIAGRMGRPATALHSALQRLQELDFVRREVPFGAPAKTTKSSLYTISDPFLRLWFRVVGPHRSALVAGGAPWRQALLARHWPHLLGRCWEQICREHLHRFVSPASPHPLARLGPWEPAARWWRTNAAEWDLVSASLDGGQLMLGEAKWRTPQDALTLESIRRLARTLVGRARPQLPPRYRDRTVRHVLFVPQTAPEVPAVVDGVFVITARDVLEVAS